jgi:hypothetical protein
VSETAAKTDAKLEAKAAKAAEKAAAKARRRVPKAPPGCLSRLSRYVLLALSLGAVVVLVDAFQVKLPIGTPGTPSRGESIGVIHVHTKVSDGNVDLDDVVSAARWADLSFVGVTDFNEALSKDIAGKDREKVLLIGGEEVATPDGHLLMLGVLPGWRQGIKDDQTAALLAAAKKAGGARFIAHPFGNVRDWNEKSWSLSKDVDGIEIANGDAEWRDNNPGELLLSGLIYSVNPDLALVRLVDRPDSSLAKWDELLTTRHVAGICGADAHARVYVGHGRSLGFPAYLRVFKVTKEHVMLAEGLRDGEAVPRDSAAIVKALKEGRSYCAVDGLSIASGFVNRVEGEGTVAGPGESIQWTPGSTLRIAIPPGSGSPRILVYKDGHPTFDSRGWRFDETLTAPGVYRTEVWLRQPGLTGWQRWAPWILSNPIYVTAGALPIPVEKAGSGTAP